VPLQTEREVGVDEACQTLADALGPKYRVSVASGSTLKVGRAGVIPAKVEVGSSHGTTTFTVHTTGLIVSRVIQACSINPRVRRALRESYPTSRPQKESKH
jgi:hypothetical protein